MCRNLGYGWLKTEADAAIAMRNYGSGNYSPGRVFLFSQWFSSNRLVPMLKSVNESTAEDLMNLVETTLLRAAGGF
jgi:hypothetical protein